CLAGAVSGRAACPAGRPEGRAFLRYARAVLGVGTPVRLGTGAHDNAGGGRPEPGMTRKSLSPRTGRPSWLTAGLLTISLGIVALVASFPLTMLKDAGWPWQSSMS